MNQNIMNRDILKVLIKSYKLTEKELDRTNKKIKKIEQELGIEFDYY